MISVFFFSFVVLYYHSEVRNNEYASYSIIHDSTKNYSTNNDCVACSYHRWFNEKVKTPSEKVGKLAVEKKGAKKEKRLKVEKIKI